MMAWPTIICGAVLIAIGTIGYAGGTPAPESGKVSPTALIPAVLGGVLALCGVLAFGEKMRKHVMHVAAVVGVLGFLGGFMPLIRQQMKGKDFDPTAPAARNGLYMSFVCLVFVGLCVQSFIDARKARKLREQQSPESVSPPSPSGG
jgi:hypothetical protein